MLNNKKIESASLTVTNSITVNPAPVKKLFPGNPMTINIYFFSFPKLILS